MMTMQGPAVALAAQGHFLAVVWHSGLPVSSDDQCLQYAVFDVSQQTQVTHHKPCCSVNITSEMHFNACQCIVQPNTALLGCILCLTQYLYDPGILPGSTDRCILGNVYLRSDLPIKPCCSRVYHLCTSVSLLLHMMRAHTQAVISSAHAILETLCVHGNSCHASAKPYAT